MSDNWQELPCEVEYEGRGRFRYYFPDKATALASKGGFGCPVCGARYDFEVTDGELAGPPVCRNGHDETVCEEAA